MQKYLSDDNYAQLVTLRFKKDADQTFGTTEKRIRRIMRFVVEEDGVVLVFALPQDVFERNRFWCQGV